MILELGHVLEETKAPRLVQNYDGGPAPKSFFI